MNILNKLNQTPKSENQLLIETSLARTTLLRNLEKLEKQGAIKRFNDGWITTERVPTSDEIKERMTLWIQQKRMDNKFRRKLNWEQVDESLQFVINNLYPNLMDENKLKSNLLSALTMVQKENNCY
jgi:DNA-binding HxlR family transcriptional regulator